MKILGDSRITTSDSLGPANRTFSVLLITRNLPPLRGGMERLNKHLAIALSTMSNLTVVGPQGCRAHLPRTVDVLEVPTHSLFRFLISSAWAAWRAAGNRKFEVVLAGSGLTALAAKFAAFRIGAKSVAYVHGLDLVARNVIYRLIWYPTLRRLDHAFANSANTADIAARIGVAGRTLSVIHPGVTLPAPPEYHDASFRQRYSLENRPVLLSVGRLTARKGLLGFIREALPQIKQSYPQVILVVIGDEAPNALVGRSSCPGESLRHQAEILGLEDNLLLLGPCDDALLSQAYFAADVHVFPVRDIPGDVEGFGMVAIEAAAHGLPTVAFAVGGVPDAVSPNRSGYLVAPGDYFDFANKVCQLLKGSGGSNIDTTARAFAAKFDWTHFQSRLQQALEQVLNPTTPVNSEGRNAHVVLNLGTRNAKAQKIEALLDLHSTTTALRILEVGTGSGGIAHYFGTAGHLNCEVYAVDVVDSRQIFEGYKFILVGSEELPFSTGSFDIVLTNHVIEHVGGREAQLRHLNEVRRVLSPKGKGYLAVPNRWQLVEPHYRLAFLSWLPEGWRTAYLRFRNRGRFYDCRPLTVAQLEALFRENGMRFQQHHGRALRLTYELEKPSSLLYRIAFKWIPDSLYERFRRIFPTLIYTFSKTPKAPISFAKNDTSEH